MRAMQGHASLAVRDWLERTIVRGNKPGASVFDIISIIHSPTNRVGKHQRCYRGKVVTTTIFCLQTARSSEMYRNMTELGVIK